MSQSSKTNLVCTTQFGLLDNRQLCVGMVTANTRYYFLILRYISSCAFKTLFELGRLYS